MRKRSGSHPIRFLHFLSFWHESEAGQLWSPAGSKRPLAHTFSQGFHPWRKYRRLVIEARMKCESGIDGWEQAIDEKKRRSLSIKFNEDPRHIVEHLLRHHRGLLTRTASRRQCSHRTAQVNHESYPYICCLWKPGQLAFGRASTLHTKNCAF